MSNVFPVKIEPPNGELLCPRCDGNYLHHEAVSVRERLKEDGPGFATSVSGMADVSIRPLESNEFEGRRGHIEIEFRCETCGERPILFIKQHKGNTEMYWRNPMNMER